MVTVPSSRRPRTMKLVAFFLQRASQLGTPKRRKTPYAGSVRADAAPKDPSCMARIKERTAVLACRVRDRQSDPSLGNSL